MSTKRAVKYCPRQVWGILIALACTHLVSAQTLPPGGYSLTAVSLVGSEYNATSSNADSILLALSDMGFGTGTTPRFRSGGASLGEDTFAFAGSGPSHVINLGGTGYEYTSGGGIFRRGRPVAMNSTGQVVGTSYRFDVGGTYLGRDVWIHDGSGSTKLIGLVGPEYEPGTTRYSEVSAINESGFAIGQSLRGGGTSTPSDVNVPLDAWLYNGTTTRMINPTGSVYEADPASGFKRTGAPIALNNLGQVAGHSRRYGPDAENMGYDAWLYAGSGPAQIISMTGTGYEGTLPSGLIVRDSHPSLINSSGRVAGSAALYSSSGIATGGNDIWLYDGTGQTKVVSLVGIPYETSQSGGVRRNAYLQFLTPSGQVVGYNQRYRIAEQVGQDAWYYDGVSTTSAINLTGAVYEYPTTGAPGRYGMAEFVSAAGHVLGYSHRYTTSGSRRGQDAWHFGGGVTRVANLTGGDYERLNGGAVERDGRAIAINAQGHGIGTSVLYGGIVGQDAWFFDGITSHRVNLAGSRYEYVVNGKATRHAQAVSLNDDDQAIGYSFQYDPSGDWIGQSGWFFDNSSGVTTALDFSFSEIGSSDSRPTILTDAGVVLGTYTLFTGAVSASRLFWWSTEAGFHDFTDLIPGGISGSGWDNLTSLMGLDTPGAAGLTSTGAPEFIAGRGKITGQTTAARSLFLLSAQVPEPTGPLAVMLLLAVLKQRPAPRRET